MTPAYGPALERYVCAGQALSRESTARNRIRFGVMEAQLRMALSDDVVKDSIAEIRERMKGGGTI